MRFLGYSQDPNPSTARRAAFQEGMGQIAQGLKGFGDIQAEQERTARQMALQEKMEKQKAFQDASSLSERLGRAVTPEEMATPEGQSQIFKELGQVKLEQRDYEREQKRLDREARKMGSKGALTFEQKKELKQMDLNARKVAEQQKNKPLTPKERLGKMGAEAQSKVGSVASGIRAITRMGEAMKSGMGPEYISSNTPFLGKVISDTDYSKEERVLSEVIGRLQSGGAINADEGERFLAMGPRPSDSPEIAKKKIEDQKKFLENKLTAFGFKTGELADLGFDIGQGKQEIEGLVDTENLTSLNPSMQTPYAPTPGPMDAMAGPSGFENVETKSLEQRRQELLMKRGN